MNLFVNLAILVTALGCSIFMAEANDKLIKGGGVTMKISKKAAKMTFFKDGDEDDGAKKVKIEFDAIGETDESGNDVGANGGKKSHVYNQFSSLDFTFEGPAVTTYQDVACLQTNFSGTLPGPDAKLLVTTYLFTADGDLVNGNESFSVTNGTFKFNIILENWKFCGGSDGDTCKKGKSNETGSEVCTFIVIKGGDKGDDVIKSKGEAKGKNEGKSTKRPKKYAIGGKGSVTLSNECNIDGEDVILDRAPTIISKGGKKIFKICFPRFKNKVIYDPSLAFDQPEDDESSAASRFVSISLITLLAGCAVFKNLF